jgi:hypothetical protein
VLAYQQLENTDEDLPASKFSPVLCQPDRLFAGTPNTHASDLFDTDCELSGSPELWKTFVSPKVRAKLPNFDSLMSARNMRSEAIAGSRQKAESVQVLRGTTATSVYPATAVNSSKSSIAGAPTSLVETETFLTTVDFVLTDAMRLAELLLPHG